MRKLAALFIAGICAMLSSSSSSRTDEELTWSHFYSRPPDDDEFNDETAASWTWSDYLASFIPGTSAWYSSASLPSKSEISSKIYSTLDYRPIRLSYLTGTPSQQETIHQAIQEMDEVLKGANSLESDCEFDIHDLLMEILGIPMALRQYYDYVQAKGKLIRELDYNLNTCSRISLMVSLLREINDSIDEMTMEQANYYNCASSPISAMEFKVEGFEGRLKNDFVAIYGKVKAADEIMVKFVTIQLGVLDELLRLGLVRIMNGLELAPDLFDSDIDVIRLVSKLIWTDTDGGLEGRLRKLLERLSEDQLVSLEAQVKRADQTYLYDCIIEELATRYDIPIELFYELLDNNHGNLDFSLLQLGAL